MNLTEAITYLTRCADANGNHWYQGHVWSDVETCPTCHGTNDAGWLRCPGSRYGYDSAECARVAYRVSKILARDSGEPIESWLDTVMSLVVNNHDDPQETLRNYAIALSTADVDEIVKGYLDAQLWAQFDYDRDDGSGNNPPLDENYSRDDIADEYVDSVRDEIAEIVSLHPLAVRMYLNQRKYRRDDGSVDPHFGHDFYLTREGHGAGFWDRGLGELGDYLTDIAKSYGSAQDLWDNGDGVLR